MSARPRVLLVEDEPSVLEIIAALLNDEYSVSTAATVADAIRQLREAEFTVVLLDCSLPNGTATEIIAACETRNVPIVLTSRDLQQRDTAGGRPYLAKPFTIDALLETLRAVLT